MRMVSDVAEEVLRVQQQRLGLRMIRVSRVRDLGQNVRALHS